MFCVYCQHSWCAVATSHLGHAEAKEIPDTIENRAAYRSLLYSTPGVGEYISGVILHWETLFQKDAAGTQMVDLIKGNGMVPGIKLDKGYSKDGLCNTKVGPLGHPETWTKGLDDLEARCAQAYAQGARFAKWRNVLQIDPTTGIPSDAAVDECVTSLARYAAICQRQRLVPIVEPEIVPNGSHGKYINMIFRGALEAFLNKNVQARTRLYFLLIPSCDCACLPDIMACAAVTERVLLAQFKALQMHGVFLEGAVLKPNMVKSGLKGPKATSEDVATATITALKRTVPCAMPGIFFLSGETVLDEDNEETATINLNTMNANFPGLPWHVSFSYGKALQKTCIVTWMGKDANKEAAQAVFLKRCKANSEANQGVYVAGSCPSVGADKSVAMQGGAY